MESMRKWMGKRTVRAKSIRILYYWKTWHCMEFGPSQDCDERRQTRLSGLGPGLRIGLAAE